MIYKRLFLVAALSLAFVGVLPGAQVASIEQGMEQFEAGDLATARATLEVALEEDGERHRALAYLGRIAVGEDELDRAIELLKEAVELQADDSMYRTWLGRAYIQKLQTVSFFERGILSGRALESLQKAVKLDPANVEARVSLAGYYLNAPAIAGGSKRKARAQADAILEVDPARGNMILSGIHMRDEEWDLALEKLDLCITSQPENLDCRFQLAMLHQELERYDDAFEAFEQVLAIEPEARGALYQLGRTAALSGTHLERGIECLETYLTLEPEPGYPGYDGAHWRLGMLLEHRGDTARARQEYEAAVALNPDEERYRDSLEQLGGA